MAESSTPRSRMYWLHALTPLHVGSGRGIGYIDLPIMRETVTHWPLVPGSAVKGVLRDSHETSGKHQPEALSLAFGRADKEGETANSGSLVFTDARTVCLPVRSLYGTFAWCTSPLALGRLRRDLESTGAGGDLPGDVRIDTSRALIATPQGEPAPLCGTDRTLYFEDLDFAAESSPEAARWAVQLARWIFPAEGDPWRARFRERFAVLSDDVFSFLCETATEVTARVRIDDDKKTVAAGALWYEEALPAETILAGLAWCDRVFGKPESRPEPETLLNDFCSGELPLQIGGKATVGRGRVRTVFSQGV